MPPRSTARSAASCSATSALPHASRSPCRPPIVWPAFACTSSTTLPSTTGPPSPKAPTCNIADWGDEQLWKAYIQLTQAEAAFRIHKDQLRVRPIWHQRADRVQAHILVCFLAFVLWKCLEMWQQRAGLGNSPRTVLEELVRIQSHDVIAPTATHGEIRLRCIAQPDDAQALLLDRLSIVLPKRMRVDDLKLPLALTG
jgi:transposase